MHLGSNLQRPTTLSSSSAPTIGASDASTHVSSAGQRPDAALGPEGGLAPLKRLGPLLLVIGCAALLIVGFVAGLTLLKSTVTIDAVFSDPADATGSRLVGLISTAGVLIWAAAVAACVFAVATLRAMGGGTRTLRWFFVASALVTLMLLLDDFLVIHELGIDVLARLTDVERSHGLRNLTELAVFLVYAIVVVAYVWRFRSLIACTEYALLILAGALLAISLAFDMLPIDSVLAWVVAPEHVLGLSIYVEEVPKLLGIVVCAIYFGRLAVREIVAAQRRQATPNG